MPPIQYFLFYIPPFMIYLFAPLETLKVLRFFKLATLARSIAHQAS